MSRLNLTQKAELIVKAERLFDPPIAGFASTALILTSVRIGVLRRVYVDL